MNKKTFVITGANSGLGRGAALLLAKRGANVVMLCRNHERGEAARSEIIAQSGNPDVELILADLGSQHSVRSFVRQFKQSHDQLHGLLNCAGILRPQRHVTEDGLETMFAVNYLGHFLLTNLLFEPLQAGSPSRVITVSGSGHKVGVEGGQSAAIDFDDLQGDKNFDIQKASKQDVCIWIVPRFLVANQPSAGMADEHQTIE